MSRRPRSRKSKRQALKKRESGFNSNCLNDKLPKYNALVDPNLRHHFESRARQKQLLKIGLIDYEGRVIDLDKNKAKVAIIEKEFELAEREEFQRMQEEQEMRRRVQKKRHDQLEEARRNEMIRRVREDRKIRKEILSVQRSQIFTPKPKLKSTSAGSAEPKAESPKRPVELAPLQTSASAEAGSFFLTQTDS